METPDDRKGGRRFAPFLLSHPPQGSFFPSSFPHPHPVKNKRNIFPFFAK